MSDRTEGDGPPPAGWPSRAELGGTTPHSAHAASTARAASPSVGKYPICTRSLRRLISPSHCRLDGSHDTPKNILFRGTDAGGGAGRMAALGAGSPRAVAALSTARAASTSLTWYRRSLEWAKQEERKEEGRDERVGREGGARDTHVRLPSWSRNAFHVTLSGSQATPQKRLVTGGSAAAEGVWSSSWPLAASMWSLSWAGLGPAEYMPDPRDLALAVSQSSWEMAAAEAAEAAAGAAGATAPPPSRRTASATSSTAFWRGRPRATHAVSAARAASVSLWYEPIYICSPPHAIDTCHRPLVVFHVTP